MNVLHSLRNIYSGPFTDYLTISTSLDSSIEQQSKLIEGLFKLHIDIIAISIKYKKPLLAQEEDIVFDAITKQIDAVKEFTAGNETSSEYLLCVSKFIDIFSWMKQKEISVFLENLNKELSIYKTNLMNGSSAYDKHWLGAWIETLEKLSNFVMSNFESGLTWTGSEKLPAQFSLGDAASEFRKFHHSALLKEINQGENIVRMLRHRTDVDGGTSNSLEE